MQFKLKELRTENKLTTQQMADKLSISKGYYSQLENYKRKLSYKLAYDISKIFNLKPDDIFYEDFKKRK